MGDKRFFVVRLQGVNLWTDPVYALHICANQLIKRALQLFCSDEFAELRHSYQLTDDQIRQTVDDISCLIVKSRAMSANAVIRDIREKTESNPAMLLFGLALLRCSIYVDHYVMQHMPPMDLSPAYYEVRTAYVSDLCEQVEIENES